MQSFQKQFSVQSAQINVKEKIKTRSITSAEFLLSPPRPYLQGDDEHAAVEAAVLSHRVLLLCDHHHVHRARKVVVVPHRCRVHAPEYTHNSQIQVDSLIDWFIQTVAANSAPPRQDTRSAAVRLQYVTEQRWQKSSNFDLK